MKKRLSLLLVLAICMSLIACSRTGNEAHDYILHLLEEGDCDMAIHVIEGLKGNTTGAPEQAVMPI